MAVDPRPLCGGHPNPCYIPLLSRPAMTHLCCESLVHTCSAKHFLARARDPGIAVKSLCCGKLRTLLLL